MKESISRRAREGAAIILSSHLLHLVEELCDEILVIRQGEKVAFGTIEALKFQIARGSTEVTLEDAFLRITAPDEIASPK